MWRKRRVHERVETDISHNSQPNLVATTGAKTTCRRFIFILSPPLNYCAYIIIKLKI